MPTRGRPLLLVTGRKLVMGQGVPWSLCASLILCRPVCLSLQGTTSFLSIPALSQWRPPCPLLWAGSPAMSCNIFPRTVFNLVLKKSQKEQLNVLEKINNCQLCFGHRIESFQNKHHRTTESYSASIRLRGRHSIVLLFLPTLWHLRMQLHLYNGVQIFDRVNPNAYFSQWWPRWYKYCHGKDQGNVRKDDSWKSLLNL